MHTFNFIMLAVLSFTSIAVTGVTTIENGTSAAAIGRRQG